MAPFDGSWQLVEVVTPSTTTPRLAGSQVTLAIQPNTPTSGTLGGNASCNRYRAAYQVVGATLTLGPAAVTRKACLDPALGLQEQRVLHLLSTVATWERHEEHLILATGDERWVWEPLNIPAKAPSSGGF